MFSNYIIWQKDIKNHPKIVGGKALNISKMLSSNINIPNGFCISTNVYNKFVSDNRIPVIKFENKIKEIGSSNITELREICDEIRILFENGKLSDEVKNIILNVYNELGVRNVVVRSSAILEDMENLSFAGLYDSFVNVVCESELIECVKKCWMSLWSLKAIYYKVKNDIFIQNKMAIIVQEMINGDASGILFTKNILNGRDEEMILNASYGICEGVVTNEVPIDTFVVNAKGDILKKHISLKTYYLTAKNSKSGIEKIRISIFNKKKSSLTNNQISCLVSMGKTIQMLFDYPQDIEWTYFNGNIYILQSRNISKSIERHKKVEPTQCWGHKKIQSYVWTRDDGPPQRYNDPISPLSESIIKTVINDGLNLALKKLPLPQTRGPILLETFNSYLYWNVETRIKIKKSLRLLYFLFKLRRAVKYSLNEYGDFLSSNKEKVSSYKNMPLNELSKKDLKEHFKNVLSIEKEYFVYEVYIGLAGEVFLDIFVDIVSRLTKMDKMEITGLLSGFENKSVRLQEDLQSAYDKISVSNNLKTFFKERGINEIVFSLSKSKNNEIIEINNLIEELIKKYGHRRLKADWQYPSLREDYSYIISILKKWVTVGKVDNPLIIDTNNRNETLIRCRQNLSNHPIKKRLFEKLWYVAQRWASVHEERQHHLNYIDDIVRRFILEIGDRLKDKGVIFDKRDVFFITLDELRGLMIYNKSTTICEAAISKRKEQWMRAFEIDPPPLISEKKQAKPNENCNIIRGLSGSPGTITGVASVIFSPEKLYKIEDIDILITRATNPSWTPIIGMSKGVVTDFGGALSHSAIIAREFGIPAVVSTQIATSVITNGKIIEVNGDKGIVKIYGGERYV